MLFFPLITQLQRSPRLFAGLVVFGVVFLNTAAASTATNKNSRPAELIGSWNEGVCFNSDELEAHAKTDATEDFVVLGVAIENSASSTNSIVTAVEGDVVGDVWGQSSALGQLDWSGQAWNDVCQTTGTTTDIWKGVVVEAVAKLKSWDKAKPWCDLDRKIKTDLGVGTADGEVIEISSIEVHRTKGGSNGQTDFISGIDAEVSANWVKKTTKIYTTGRTGETVEVFVTVVNQTNHCCASVIGQASGKVEFREIHFSTTKLAVLKGIDVLSAQIQGELLCQRDVEAQTDVESVVSTIQTALIVAGVISDGEACAHGVEQSAVFFRSRWNDAFAWSGSTCNCIQARASGQNEC